MIAPEVIVKIRQLYFAEHWKVGTIAAQLGVHHDTVRAAIGAESFNRGTAGTIESTDGAISGLHPADIEAIPAASGDSHLPDDSRSWL